MKSCHKCSRPFNKAFIINGYYRKTLWPVKVWSGKGIEVCQDCYNKFYKPEKLTTHGVK